MIGPHSDFSGCIVPHMAPSPDGKLVVVDPAYVPSQHDIDQHARMYAGDLKLSMQWAPYADSIAAPAAPGADARAIRRLASVPLYALVATQDVLAGVRAMLDEIVRRHGTGRLWLMEPGFALVGTGVGRGPFGQHVEGSDEIHVRLRARYAHEHGCSGHVVRWASDMPRPQGAAR